MQHEKLNEKTQKEKKKYTGGKEQSRLFYPMQLLRLSGSYLASTYLVRAKAVFGQNSEVIFKVKGTATYLRGPAKTLPE